MKKNAKFSIVILLVAALALSLVLCVACDKQPQLSEWQSDATHHWKVALEGYEGQTFQRAEHQYDNATDTTCNICQYVRTINGGGNGGSDENITYTAKILRSGGQPFADINVYVYTTGNQPVTYGYTDEEGSFSFSAPQGEYKLNFGRDFPVGYNASECKLTASEPNKEFRLSASLINSAMPKGTTYSLGDVLYNFSFTDSLGRQSSIAKILQTKKAVLLNFWFVNCSWCVVEFPDMQEAYNRYQDDVEIVALNFTDSTAATEQFRTNKNGTYNWDTLTFPMVGNENEVCGLLANAFGVEGCPTSVLIDREGVICFYTGGAGDLDEFLDLFSYYSAEPYVQRIHFPGENTQDVPDVEAPTAAQIQTAINNTQSGMNATFELDSDEYNWPWIISEDGHSIQASNSGHHNSYAILSAQITATTQQAIAFDYKTSSESRYDVLYVFVDNVVTHQFSGVMSDWETCYAYVPIKNGTYTISFAFVKDEDRKSGDDTAYISNLRFVNKNSIDVRSEIVYPCATDQNSVTGIFGSYADVVYNDIDNYYHVGTANGPLVMADLMNPTAWNGELSAWEHVAKNGLVYDLDKDGEKENYTDLFTSFAQYANNSRRTGLIGVTKELYTCLQALTAKFGSGGANEWLQLCCYFVVYGGEPNEMVEDPIIGLSYYTAYQARLTTNEQNPVYNIVYKPNLVMPRGIWFEFTPAETAVYYIRSLGEIDSYLWIRNDKLLFIAENDDDKSFQGDAKYAGNFGLKIAMQAGKTYFILCDYNTPDTVGEFSFLITKLGNSGKIWADATAGEYTANFDSQGNMSNIKVKDAVEYILGEDGNYHVKNSDGTVGELLYINLFGPTDLFPSYSVAEMVSLKCYFCLHCGNKYNASVAAFERENVPVCWACGSEGKASFCLEPINMFQLPTAQRTDDGKVSLFYFVYEDDYVEGFPLYELDTPRKDLLPENYLEDLLLYELKLVDYTDRINYYLAEAAKTENYPTDPQELGATGDHVGYVPASAELVDILQKFIIFGAYAFDYNIENAWLMMANYFQTL